MNNFNNMGPWLKKEFDITKLQEASKQVTDITPIPEDTKIFIPFQKHLEPNKNKKYHQLSLSKRPNSVSGEWGYVWIKDGKTIKEYCDKHQVMILRNSEAIEIDGFQKNYEYTEFVPTYNHTYFKDVYEFLSSKMRIGRMRLVKYYPFMTTEWYKDCENKIIIPIETDDNIKVVIENEVRTIPLGQTWYANTKDKYHLICNGSNTDGMYLIISLGE